MGREKTMNISRSSTWSENNNFPSFQREKTTNISILNMIGEQQLSPVQTQKNNYDRDFDVLMIQQIDMFGKIKKMLPYIYNSKTNKKWNKIISQLVSYFFMCA